MAQIFCQMLDWGLPHAASRGTQQEIIDHQRLHLHVIVPGPQGGERVVQFTDPSGNGKGIADHAVQLAGDGLEVSGHGGGLLRQPPHRFLLFPQAGGQGLHVTLQGGDGGKQLIIVVGIRRTAGNGIDLANHRRQPENILVERPGNVRDLPQHHRHGDLPISRLQPEKIGLPLFIGQHGGIPPPAVIESHLRHLCKGQLAVYLDPPVGGQTVVPGLAHRRASLYQPSSGTL